MLRENESEFQITHLVKQYLSLPIGRLGQTISQDQFVHTTIGTPSNYRGYEGTPYFLTEKKDTPLYEP